MKIRTAEQIRQWPCEKLASKKRKKEQHWCWLTDKIIKCQSNTTLFPSALHFAFLSICVPKLITHDCMHRICSLLMNLSHKQAKSVLYLVFSSVALSVRRAFFYSNFIVCNTELFNFSLYLKGIWPEDWKKSIFIPIYKKGDRKECSNYRTISLIPHASKVLIKIIMDRLTIHRQEKSQKNKRVLRRREDVGIKYLTSGQ